MDAFDPPGKKKILWIRIIPPRHRLEDLQMQLRIDFHLPSFLITTSFIQYKRGIFTIILNNTTNYRSEYIFLNQT